MLFLITAEAEALADAILAKGVLLERTFADALHIAVATVHEVVNGSLVWSSSLHPEYRRTRRPQASASLRCAPARVAEPQHR